MPDTPTIQMDLYRDWIEELKAELRADGYEVNDGEDPQTLAIKYFNVQKRDIDDAKREVHLSSELQAKLKAEPDLKAPVDEIKRKAEAGENLTPHLSKKLLKLNFNDPLLNDWGIHHFHLGMKIESKGFTERSGPLLFAMVCADAILMINIFDHGAWAEKELVEILHRNWPNFMKQFQAHGLSPDAEDYDEQTRRQLRDANVQAFTKMSDGTWYAPMGGGVTTAGTAADLTQFHDAHKWMLEDYEHHIHQNIDDIVEQARDQGVELGDELEFRLHKQGDEVKIVEVNSNVGIGTRDLSADVRTSLGA